MLECKTGIRTVFTNASGSIRNCEREKLRVKRWVTPNSNFYYTFECRFVKPEWLWESSMGLANVTL